jgi:porin-like protein
MKMVKSLLLGSAAGLVAVGGAQAADLPVKAKPVEYVKVCSLYGAGYYYIPGTDICMHLGGYVRQEWGYLYGENLTAGPWVSSSMQNTRINGTRDLVWRTRAYITQETRQQTAYGTLRTYLNIGINGNNSSDFSANRAFIQIAGFTAGLASSYFDHYSVAAIAYLVDQSSDTGDGGQRVFAYTAQLGNGISASLSAEEPEAKRGGVWNTALGNPTLGVTSTTQALQDQGKSAVPDFVGNVRIDGAWGSAQVMGVVKHVQAGYYGTTTTGSLNNGYPSDTWGWAVGGGIKINLPFAGPGDYIAAQAAYTEGAVRYISNTNGASGVAAFAGGGSGIAGTVGAPGNLNAGEIGYGYWSDAVYCGTAVTVANPTGGVAGTCPNGQTGLQLTTAWGIAGGWEHFWTPSLRTSIHGSYVGVRYSAGANANICGAQTGATANTISFTQGGASGVATCNNNFNVWQIGSRSQWNVTKDFYMGFDIVYYRLETASGGAVVNYTALAGGAQPTGLRTIADQEVLAGRFRWHRDLP